jgi:hypothetical protein
LIDFIFLTSSIYTPPSKTFVKLWKYQQQHRAVLEDKEKYGLKRWEIGEIASKIGQ